QGLIAYMEAMEGPRHGWSGVSGTRDDHFAYMRSPQPELYDLSRDGGETANLAVSQADTAAGYRARLEALDASAAGREALPDRKEMLPAMRHVERVRMAAQSGQQETAVREARAGLQERPGDLGLHALLGGALASLERWDEAVAEYRAVLQALPQDREAL